MIVNIIAYPIRLLLGLILLAAAVVVGLPLCCVAEVVKRRPRFVDSTPRRLPAIEVHGRLESRVRV